MKSSTLSKKYRVAIHEAGYARIMDWTPCGRGVRVMDARGRVIYAVYQPSLGIAVGQKSDFGTSFGEMFSE